MKLSATNLKKVYNQRTVVKSVSLEVNQGEIIGLLGPNGAGKTTSFYMIVGLVRPNGGAIYLDEKEITDYPMYKRAQNGIGYLAQEASVFRKLSVEENILSVLQTTSLSKTAQKEKMEELLEEFSLTHIRKNRGDLPGVPSLTPEVTNGDLGSFGTAFLLTVIFTSPNAFSKSLPVISLFIKSTSTI